MRRLRRALELVALTAACARPAGPPPAPAPTGLSPDGATRESLTRAVESGVRPLLATLERGRDGYRALRMRRHDLVGWMRPETLEQMQRARVGLVPGPLDPRWQSWATRRGSALVGWCARGARQVEPGGREGFLVRTITVDRLLLVAARGGRRWGAWVEGLVLTRDGWRFLPWVPVDRAVEAPRWDHADLSLWDCDVGRRPP